MEHRRRTASARGPGQQRSVSQERQCFVGFLGLRQYWIKREEAAIEALAAAEQQQQQQQRRRRREGQEAKMKMALATRALRERETAVEGAAATTTAAAAAAAMAEMQDENANGGAGNTQHRQHQQHQQQQQQQQSGHPLLNSSVACRLSFAEVEVSSASALSIGGSSVPAVAHGMTAAAVAAAERESKEERELGAVSSGSSSSSSSSGIATQAGEEQQRQRQQRQQQHQMQRQRQQQQQDEDDGFVEEDEVCVTFDAEEPLGLRLRETLYPAPRVSITEAEMKTATAAATATAATAEPGLAAAAAAATTAEATTTTAEATKTDGVPSPPEGAENFVCGPPVVIARFLRRDSPAALARVVAVGDAISRVAGVEVTSWPLERVVEAIGRARAEACAPGGGGAVQIHFARLWDGVGRRETRGGADGVSCEQRERERVRIARRLKRQLTPHPRPPFTLGRPSLCHTLGGEEGRCLCLCRDNGTAVGQGRSHPGNSSESSRWPRRRKRRRRRRRRRHRSTVVLVV